MAQVFIVGDIVGEVTVGGPIQVDGNLSSVDGAGDPIATSWSISTPPLFGTVTLLPDTGTSQTVQWTYVLDETNSAVQDLAFGETLTDTFVVQSIDLNSVVSQLFPTQQEITITINGVCFLSGTKIATEDGPVTVENIVEGQLVQTRDAGLQPVLWAGGQWYDEPDWQDTPSLWPVRIKAGALGPDEPTNDLYVSQQHRMRIANETVLLEFGFREALVAAKHLCVLPDVDVVEPPKRFGYFHVLCDGHHLVEAEGTWAETIFLGDEALLSLSPTELERLVARFASWPLGDTQVQFLRSTCLPVLKAHEAATVLHRPSVKGPKEASPQKRAAH